MIASEAHKEIMLCRVKNAFKLIACLYLEEKVGLVKMWCPKAMSKIWHTEIFYSYVFIHLSLILLHATCITTLSSIISCFLRKKARGKQLPSNLQTL